MSSPFPALGQDPAAWVAAAVPGPLMRALDRRGGMPHGMRQEIARQLADGTSAARLRERIERRWWERYAHLPGPDLLERADDIALDLVAVPTCPLGCEDGWLIEQSRVCPWCRPNGTVIDVHEEDGGRRLDADGQARRAAEVRAAMRANRRYPRPAR
ncbi:hypothetical protein [Kitasatospora sp. NPDC059571]|uniref:hypothetical protein n=1 Tax=Kitasatospora sp. NPDC059571 TaxID=3346871 RepID=UPI0036AC9FA1